MDTNGVDIGMIAYGNDDLFAGQAYNIGGATIFSDDWVWSTNEIPEPSTVGLLGLAGMGMFLWVRHRRKRVLTS